VIAAPLWAEYSRTVVEMVVPDGASFVIHPATAGDVGQWPPFLVAPVHFLTAWDPDDERPGEAENRRRGIALEADLRDRGLSVWRTVGRDLESDHTEEGVAVVGMTETEAIALARRYRQNAIFSWTPTAWSVVSCVDDARHDAGWRLEPLWS
jgi:hypothetical protein